MAEQMDKIGKKMKKYSYWLDTVDQDFLKDANLPEKSDALVVGFGYTGSVSYTHLTLPTKRIV